MKNFRVTGLLLVLLFTFGCGDDDATTAATETEVEGVFVDGVVRGLEYTSGTFTGTTDGLGAYSCAQGQNIVFKINGKLFATATCGSMITPYTITSDSTELNNIAYLLTNLDDDGNLVNGIDITNNKVNVTSDIDLSSDAIVSAIVATELSGGNSVTRAAALNHLAAFAGNSGTYTGLFLITDDPGEDCGAVGSNVAASLYFNGKDFVATFEGIGGIYTPDHFRNDPTASVSAATLSFGGTVTPNASNSGVTIASDYASVTSGTPAYYKDPEVDSGDICLRVGYTYVDDYMRLSDVSMVGGAITGKWAYTEVCDNNGTKLDYDECSGTFAISK